MGRFASVSVIVRWSVQHARGLAATCRSLQGRRFTLRLPCMGKSARMRHSRLQHEGVSEAAILAVGMQ